MRLRDLAAQFGATLMLLTRLPASWLVHGRAYPPAGACVWAYPLVGALVGAIGAAVLWAGTACSMPPGLRAIWALTAMTLVTGGMHLDGLADMADGFGGGRSRAEKLAIMRDSRVGSFGVLAIVFGVAVSWAALTSLAGRGGAGLIAAGALSRAGMAAPLLLLGPAREGGLGAGIGAVPAASAVGCAVLGCGCSVLVLGSGSGLGAIVAAALGSGLVTWVAQRQIGGFTGDVLGGCAVIVEGVVLTVIACG